MGGGGVVHPGAEPLAAGIPEPAHRCDGGAEFVEESHRPFPLLLCVTCHADSNLGLNPVQLFVRTAHRPTLALNLSKTCALVDFPRRRAKQSRYQGSSTASSQGAAELDTPRTWSKYPRIL